MLFHFCEDKINKVIFAKETLIILCLNFQKMKPKMNARIELELDIGGRVQLFSSFLSTRKELTYIISLYNVKQ